MSFIGFSLPMSVEASDKATAEKLFKEGKQLIKRGKITEACDKFAESQRIDPSAGTMLNLADCYARLGKTASAWAQFLETKRAAEAARREVIAAEAAKRAKELKDLLSYLTIDLEAKVEGLEITRNGKRLESASLGTALPIDPGEHRIEAKAPGYQSFKVEVPIGDKQSKRIEIPLLKRRVPQPPPVPSKPPRLKPIGKDKPVSEPMVDPGPPILAYLTGGTGIVTLGVGVLFAVLAADKYETAEELCPDHDECLSEAMSERNYAEIFANVANVTIPVGAIALAAGIILLVTHPDRPSKERSTHSSIQWMPAGTTGILKGHF